MRLVRATLLVTLLPAFLLAAGLSDPTTLIVPLSSDDLMAIESSTEQRYRVGVTHPTNVEVDLSGVREADLERGPRALPFGRVERTDAGFTFSATVESPGAVALRVHFTNFNLPRNATLTLSNESGQAFAYSGSGPRNTGEFWSNTVGGDRVQLRVDYAGRDIGRVLQAMRFLIADVGPLSARFPAPDPQAGQELCGYNETCVINASCASLPSAVQTAQDAVAMILFISGPYQYVCSGGLVADSDSSSSIPYFITANHCLDTATEAATLEAYFDYTSPCGQCDDSILDEPMVAGSSVVSTSKTSDYTLLRLATAAPAGTAFLTWNNTPVASSNNTALYRISHPAGAPQAYSAQRVDTSKGTCRSWPRGSWIYSTDTVGATEGGSSGSPVVNASGQLVGQLSGACGFNVNDPCDEVQNATVDGAFAAYYSKVATWLGPGTSCTDNDGDGYCTSEGDCNDNNAAVHPGASEVCGDGLDNDCDGLTDSSDPSCQTGGCDLLPVGGSCSSNDQCCSGSCKGKPGAKKCK